MENEQILAGNKLIAEFMGAYYCNDDRNAYPDGYWMCSDEFIELPYNINDFKFHSSWDWLMTVVEKIENMSEGTNIIIGTNGCLITVSLPIYFRCQVDVCTKIEAVWSACVEYVKWYKKQLKNGN